METPTDSMILNRTDFTDSTTISDVYADGQWQCFVLEPTCRKQEGVKLAIPQGRYQLVMYDSPHFTLNRASKYFGKKVPLLLGVPGHDYVEIHPGNCLKDTHDCLLPGQAKDVDLVAESEAAWEVICQLIEQKLKAGPFYIGITGGAPN